MCLSCEDIARQSCAMVPMRFLATFLRPVFSASRLQQDSDLHLKFALRPHHVWKYGRHPIFGKFLLCPNGWMHQDATWYGGRPQPRGLCVRCGPSPLLHKNGAEPPPQFSAMSVVAKLLDGSILHLAWRWALVQAT